MNAQEESGYQKNKSRTIELEARVARIRALNDELRGFRRGGYVTITPGIQALGQDSLQAIVYKVATFDSFTGDNDPHGEHDFGALEHEGKRIFFKIDYYDKSLEYGSPDPANPDVTARVLTIMLASEY
ncbi:DUF3768 domain-containing protein [Sphingomonas bisphenolicum]|uniref:DUF3768 domain-containing protein n=1 Tax=Sphingomonas bisphenolicum TaxID=296544 RepID=A0ABN5WDD4_9SPHN|nr:DUF3768 domain-containing protein [Sphingomonas bisphenolicum]BBF68390.1 hypothetical protein SBA_ch1_05900 [Sphingomonas bisphenolicum]